MRRIEYGILALVLCGVIVLGGCTRGSGKTPKKDPTELFPDKYVIVAQDGSGDYTTVQAAFDAIPPGNTRLVVYVRNGIYNEKVLLAAGRDQVILVGESVEGTVITHDDWADRETSPGSGETLGTAGSYTFAVEANDFMAVGLTIRNTFQNNTANAARYPNRTQGVAVMVKGDRATFYDCRIEGNQDTFLGWNKGRVYLNRCYVEGNVDFIFGNSVMVFDRCTIFSNREYSVITAAATPAGMKFGIVFLDCDLQTPQANTPDFNGNLFVRFYLGRPWQGSPQTVFIRCNEPSTLHPDGWTTMAVDAGLYAEYRCTGPGASADRLAQRKMGGRQLSDAEAALYTLENIFARETYVDFTADWIPPARYPDPQKQH